MENNQNAKKLKILIVSSCYYPEQFRVTDIAENLVQLGNDVTVLTGKPCYGFKDGLIPKEYKNGRNYEVINGVKVIRVNQYPRKTGFINRFFNYYSFLFKSEKMVKKLDKDFDVVLVNQLSPVMQIGAGAKYKKKYGAKLVVYCLDIWPESLTAGGIKKGSLIYKYYHKVSKKLYKKADKILVTSKSFVEYFSTQFGIEGVKHLPQYAEELFEYEDCVKPKDQYIDAMFAGNIGHAQSVETIIRASALLKDYPSVRFHIVGDGERLEDCKALAKNLGVNSVYFHGRKPLSEMPKTYALADVMLVTLTKDDFASMTMPGKVQTYLRAGKPIISSADGETKIEVEASGCGFTAPAEDYEALAKCIVEFAEYEDKNKLTQSALQYYKENFSKQEFMKILINELV